MRDKLFKVAMIAGLTVLWYEQRLNRQLMLSIGEMVYTQLDAEIQEAADAIFEDIVENYEE